MGFGVADVETELEVRHARPITLVLLLLLVVSCGAGDEALSNADDATSGAVGSTDDAAAQDDPEAGGTEQGGAAGLTGTPSEDVSVGEDGVAIGSQEGPGEQFDDVVCEVLEPDVFPTLVESLREISVNDVVSLGPGTCPIDTVNEFGDPDSVTLVLRSAGESSRQEALQALLAYREDWELVPIEGVPDGFGIEESGAYLRGVVVESGGVIGALVSDGRNEPSGAEWTREVAPYLAERIDELT